jgi:AcrR family transcriptional regulator
MAIADVEIRSPQQVRSRKSLEKVLSAGVALLAERGYDGLSIAEVSTRARVSVGSIYQRFPSKAVLFRALQERMLSLINAEQEALFDGIDASVLDDGAIIDMAVHRVADHFRRHEPLLRVMIMRGATDEETRVRGSGSAHVLAQSFERFLGKSLRMKRRDAMLATDMCFRIVYASLARRILWGPTFESPVELSWDTFVSELSRACRAYLLAPGAHSRLGENA